ELVQDVRSGSDRIAGVEQRPLREHRRGDESESGRFIAGDVAILARSDGRSTDAIVSGEYLSRVGVCESGFQRGQVCHLNVLLLELGLYPSLGRLERPV